MPGVQHAATAVSLPPDQVTVTDNFTAEGQHYAVGEIGAGRDDDGRERVVLRRARHSAGSWTAVRRARSRGRTEAVVIVNRTLADRYYPNGDAVGRRFRTGGPERPNERLDARRRHRRRREVQRAGRAGRSGVLSAVPAAVVVGTVRRGPHGRAARQRGCPVRDAVWSIDRELPIARSRTMDQMLGEASADSRFRAYLLGAFGALGLILAAIGVYGVMAYAVAQRARELGVRAALGARPKDSSRLVVRDAGLLAVAGVIVGLLGAWTLTGLPRNSCFRCTPRDPATFVVTAAVVLQGRRCWRAGCPPAAPGGLIPSRSCGSEGRPARGKGREKGQGRSVAAQEKIASGVGAIFGIMERETGFEPATSTLARSHSTTELFPPSQRTAAPGTRPNRCL